MKKINQVGNGVGVERCRLDKLIRESLFKNIFELRPKGWQVSGTDIWRKKIPGRGESKYKTLR